MTEWINVKDRLPDQGQYVLTYAKDHRPRYQLGFYSTFSGQWLKTSTPYVEYWMELPKSPDKDNE